MTIVGTGDHRVRDDRLPQPLEVSDAPGGLLEAALGPGQVVVQRRVHASEVELAPGPGNR